LIFAAREAASLGGLSFYLRRLLQSANIELTMMRLREIANSVEAAQAR
jgi:hypothetical protein